MNVPDVPFVRPLYPIGSRRHSKPGVDVVGIKRALARAAYLSWAQFDPSYNKRAERAVRTFQSDHGIRSTGNYGLITHEALRRAHREGYPDEPAFDAYAISLMRQADRRDTRRTIVDRGLDAAAYWIVHRAEIDYQQVRPFPVVAPPALPAYTDCSGFVTTVYFAAGAPDPNGRGYDGYGYTGTLMSNGTQVALDQLQAMDLVFYGRTSASSPAFPSGSPTHVAVALGGSYVASNGSDSGPLKLNVAYRSDLHSVRRYALTR